MFWGVPPFFLNTGGGCTFSIFFRGCPVFFFRIFGIFFNLSDFGNLFKFTLRSRESSELSSLIVGKQLISGLTKIPWKSSEKFPPCTKYPLTSPNLHTIEGLQGRGNPSSEASEDKEDCVAWPTVQGPPSPNKWKWVMITETVINALWGSSEPGGHSHWKGVRACMLCQIDPLLEFTCRIDPFYYGRVSQARHNIE